MTEVYEASTTEENFEYDSINSLIKLTDGLGNIKYEL